MPIKNKPAATEQFRAPLSQRVGVLERERARLEEEVLQLRAAIHIWTEVFGHRLDELKQSPAVGLEGR
jgi:hypothetical protein